MRTKQALTTLTAASLVLSACGEERQEGPDPQPEPPVSVEPTPDVTETPAASIIRPDVTQEPVVEAPPEPLALSVPFPEGGAQLNDEAVRIVAKAVTSEQLDQGWPVILRGHSDAGGSDQANLIASRRRAEAVKKALVEAGVAAERIEVMAIGEQNPIADNAQFDGTPDEAGRARNRRVDIWIAPQDVRPVDTRDGGQTAQPERQGASGEGA